MIDNNKDNRQNTMYFKHKDDNCCFQFPLVPLLLLVGRTVAVSQAGTGLGKTTTTPVLTYTHPLPAPASFPLLCYSFCFRLKSERAYEITTPAGIPYQTGFFLRKSRFQIKEIVFIRLSLRFSLCENGAPSRL